MFAFMIFFYALYFYATELNSEATSTAEYLIFRRGHVPSYLQERKRKDEETVAVDEKPPVSNDAVEEQQAEQVKALPAQIDVFTWRDVTLDIRIKGEPRRLLDGISGWVKPGTLTALMGTSGAGKTTLLDALAQRTNIGVLTGDMVSPHFPDLRFTLRLHWGPLLTPMIACEWQALRRIFSAQYGICSTARSASGDDHSPRSASIFGLPAPASNSIYSGEE